MTLIELGSYSDLPISGSEPRIPAVFLDRSRLYDRLDDTAGAPAVGIVAPPGWGKSLLVAGWARAREVAGRLLWLDARVPLAQAAELVRGASVTSTVDRIVVDDLHLVDAEAAAALLRELATCGLPILALSRRPVASVVRAGLGVRPEEIATDELGFTDDEVVALFELADRQPSADGVRRLREVTDGWPVAVRGAALAPLASVEQPGEPPQFRPGRSVLEFVEAEIVADLPGPLLDAALRASVVDRLTTELADELLEPPASAVDLDGLVEAGLMTHDGDAWRFVPGLAACLRELMRRRCPASYAGLQARTARWYAARGASVRALAHAELSGDHDLVAGLLRGSWTSLVIEDPERLRSVLLAVPQELRRDHRELRLALAASWTGVDAAAARDLLRSARGVDGAPPGDTEETLRADLLENLVAMMVAGRAGDSLVRERIDADELLERIGRLAAEPGPALTDAITAFAIVHGTSLLVSGLLDRAAAVFRLGSSHASFAGRRDRECVLQAHEAMCSVLDGDLEAAAGSLERIDGHPYSPAATASVALARGLVELERGEAARSQRHLVEARRGRLDPALRPLLRHAEGLADLLLGDYEVGLERLGLDRPGRSQAGGARPRHAAYVGGLLQGTRQLLAARVSAAAPVEEQDAGHSAWARMAQVTHLLLRGDSRAALDRARGEIEQAGPESRRTRIDFLLVAAAAAMDADDQTTALAWAERALGRAELTGSWRAVQQLPRAVITRLLVLVEHRSASTAGRALATATRLRLGLPAPGDGERATLTRRELLVLAELGTGRSASMIAADLFVSPNTLKTQLRSIYRKLGVSSRAEAVDLSRELGII